MAYNISTKAQLISLLESGVATALGAVAGVSSVDKFGHCSSATAVKTDVWSLGASVPVYLFPNAAGESLTLESSSTSDTIEIIVQGLDIAGVEVEVKASLTGTIPVNLAGVFTAVNRAFNNGLTASVGSIRVKGSVSGNTFAHFTPDEQQTTQCIYTVPSDKYCLLKSISGSMNNSSNQDASALATLGVQQPGGVFRTQRKHGLQKRGTSHFESKLAIPYLYPPGTRIKMSITPDTTAMDVSADFSCQLIDSAMYDGLI